jgi:uncharacterized membrane protein YfcA
LADFPVFPRPFITLLLGHCYCSPHFKWRGLSEAQKADENEVSFHPHLIPSIAAGAVIGYIAGVTGIGGGILLAPLILMLRWDTPRTTTGISAAFNLLNSAAALAGLWFKAHEVLLPPSLWILAVIVGGSVGTWLSIRQLPTWAIRVGLAALLTIAGLRMLDTHTVARPRTHKPDVRFAPKATDYRPAAK